MRKEAKPFNNNVIQTRCHCVPRHPEQGEFLTGVRNALPSFRSAIQVPIKRCLPQPLQPTTTVIKGP